MATMKQREAARRNIQKAQAAWQSMSRQQHAQAQPEGRARQKPGTGGEGDYYHVTVRPREDFVTFRTQDVGEPGHVQRVAGKRSSGSWSTQKWLISKEDAHVEDGKLIPDTAGAKDVLAKLGSKPVHVKGDIFEATPRPNVPEREKPTPAQQRARRANIQKAQAARRARST
ncbi:MAG: hypothetical protein L0Z62_31560 [Gemmataceae bacterium]|nr:hypothetical protein [Gemmataceae bacterium]